MTKRGQFFLSPTRVLRAVGEPAARGTPGSRIVSTKVIENSTGDAALAEQATEEVKRIRFVAPVRNCRKVAFLYNDARSF